jgi:hypothetical protein
MQTKPVRLHYYDGNTYVLKVEVDPDDMPAEIKQAVADDETIGFLFMGPDDDGLQAYEEWRPSVTPAPEDESDDD